MGNVSNRKRFDETMRANYRLERKSSEREWDKLWLRTHSHQAYLSLFGRP